MVDKDIIKRWNSYTYHKSDSFCQVLENQEFICKKNNFPESAELMKTLLDKFEIEFYIAIIFNMMDSSHTDTAFYVKNSVNEEIHSKLRFNMSLKQYKQSFTRSDLINYFTYFIFDSVNKVSKGNDIKYLDFNIDTYKDIDFYKLEIIFDNYIKNEYYNNIIVGSIVCSNEIFNIIKCFDKFGLASIIDSIDLNLRLKGYYGHFEQEIYIYTYDKLYNNELYFIPQKGEREEKSDIFIDPTLMFSIFVPINCGQVYPQGIDVEYGSLFDYKIIKPERLKLTKVTGTL